MLFLWDMSVSVMSITSAKLSPWKYNTSVSEYFVETEETSKIRRSDLDKQTRATEEASLLDNPKSIKLSPLQ